MIKPILLQDWLRRQRVKIDDIPERVYAGDLCLWGNRHGLGKLQALDAKPSVLTTHSLWQDSNGACFLLPKDFVRRCGDGDVSGHIRQVCGLVRDGKDAPSLFTDVAVTLMSQLKEADVRNLARIARTEGALLEIVQATDPRWRRRNGPTPSSPGIRAIWLDETGHRQRGKRGLKTTKAKNQIAKR
jgi:hypothetical protein